MWCSKVVVCISLYLIFSAWTKADLIHLYGENIEKYAQGSKRSMFLNAVKSIEKAVERFQQGIIDLKIFFALHAFAYPIVTVTLMENYYIRQLILELLPHQSAQKIEQQRKKSVSL